MIVRPPANSARREAASAVYFYGRRSDTALSPKELIRFYDQQTDLCAGRPRPVTGSRARTAATSS
jgi:hypothetical protein